MKVFPLIKTVLDEIYVRIAGEQEEKDPKISEQIQALKATYARLAEGAANNYADDVTRFAYIYKYVTSHANVVYQLVPRCRELVRLFDREQVSITCIGGGPGSDFLGLLKYLIRNGKTPRVKCTLFDKEQAWAECWADVDEKLRSELQISTFFVQFDVTKPETWDKYQKFLASDLFTMVYFMSEVYGLRREAEAFFAYLFEKAKPDALLLFVDNRSAVFYEWFDSLVRKYNWKVLCEDRLELKMEDVTEERTDLGEYHDKFGYPKLKADIAFRICQKQ
jgi:Putative SAM-dependent methyltransferase